MKNALFTAVFIFTLSACSLVKPSHEIEKTLVDATAQKWHGGVSGVEGADRGVTFRMKFYKPKSQFQVDTLWINSVALLPEVTAVGDSTYISAFYFSANGKDKTLINDTLFSGVLSIFLNAKRHLIGPEPFRQLPVIPYM